MPAQRHWSGWYQVAALLTGSTFRAQRAADVNASDREHDGAAEAGVSRDPYSPPSSNMVGEHATAALVDAIGEVMAAELNRRSHERALGCPGALQWNEDALQCWAETQHLLGTPLSLSAPLAAAGSALTCR